MKNKSDKSINKYTLFIIMPNNNKSINIEDVKLKENQIGIFLDKNSKLKFKVNNKISDFNIEEEDRGDIKNIITDTTNTLKLYSADGNITTIDNIELLLESKSISRNIPDFHFVNNFNNDLLEAAKSQNNQEINNIIKHYKILSQKSLNDALKITNKTENWDIAYKLIEAGANPEIILSKALSNAHEEKAKGVLDLIFAKHNDGTKRLSQATLNKALKKSITLDDKKSLAGDFFTNDFNNNFLYDVSLNDNINDKSIRTQCSMKLIEAGANPQIFYDSTKGKKDNISSSNKNITSFIERHAGELHVKISKGLDNITHNSDHSRIVEDIIKFSLYDKNNATEKTAHASFFLGEFIDKNPQAKIMISEDMKTILNDLPVDYSTSLLYKLSKITSKEVMDEAFSRNAAWKKISNLNNKIEQEFINLVRKISNLPPEDDKRAEEVEKSSNKIAEYFKESKLNLDNDLMQRLDNILNNESLKTKIITEYSKTSSWVEKLIKSVEEGIKSIFAKKEIFNDKKIFLEHSTSHSAYIKNIDNMLSRNFYLQNDPKEFSPIHIKIIQELAKIDKKCHSLKGDTLEQEITKTSKKISDILNSTIDQNEIKNIITKEKNILHNFSKFIDKSEKRKEFYGHKSSILSKIITNDRTISTNPSSETENSRDKYDYSPNHAQSIGKSRNER